MDRKTYSSIKVNNSSKEECKESYINIEKITREEAQQQNFDISIIFIGAVGSGKSSLINLFANCYYSNKANNIFIVSDNQAASNINNIFERKTGRVKILENEATERVTKSNLYFNFKLNHKNLLLIDTPGISECLSNASDEDLNLFNETKELIEVLNIKYIVFVQKTTEVRLCKTVKDFVNSLNELILKMKVDIKIILALTFYPESIIFNKSEIPFEISETILLNNSIFNRNLNKPYKAKSLCEKLKKAFSFLFQFMDAGRSEVASIHETQENLNFCDKDLAKHTKKDENKPIDEDKKDGNNYTDIKKTMIPKKLIKDVPFNKYK